MRTKSIMLAVGLLVGCVSPVTPESEAPESDAIGQPATDPSSDEAAEPTGFTTGDTAPTEFYAVGNVTTVIQTFVSDGESIQDLELLLVHSEDAKEPLTVEVRSDKLDRRYGWGKIDPGAAEKPAWRSVDWDVTPRLEIDGHYRIVVFSDAPYDAWKLLGGVDAYPEGGARPAYGNPEDIGFRIRFEGGQITDSKMIRPRVIPTKLAYPGREFGLHRAEVGWGVKLQVGHTKDPPLPMCVRTRCGDVYATPMGDAEERAKRAKASTAKCDQQETEIVVLKVTQPELGFTCRDACTGHGYDCGGMAFRDDVCAVPGDRDGFYGWKSCDRVLSASLTHTEKSCFCEEGKGQ